MTIPISRFLLPALLATLAAAPATAEPAPLSAYSYARQVQSTDALVRAASAALLAAAPDPELERLARMLEADHGRSAARFGAWTARAAGETAPLLTTDARRLRKLERAARDGRAQDLLEELIEIHEAALALHQAYARTGAHPELRQAATLAAPALAGHLTELRRLAAARD